MATIDGDGSDNTLNGTSQADVISGGTGNDTIFGGDGDDTITGGDASLLNSFLFLNWMNQGSNADDVSNGFTQNTGGINVTVSLEAGSAGTAATIRTNETYVDTDDPFSDASGLALQGSGSGTTWTTDINFAAVSGSGFNDEVENVSFRLQDVDASDWVDVVTVNAYDADGNVVVSLTPSGDDTVDGNTVTAGDSATGLTSAEGSVLVEIAGPVSRIEIIYENGGSDGQVLLVTDVHFEAVPSDDDILYGEAGNDTIFGGEGDDFIDGGDDNDTLSGGEGDDELYGGSGSDDLTGGEGADILSGGDDNDTFHAAGGDTIIGGEGGVDTADTLIVDDVERVEYDPADGESGTVYFNDGTTATFTGIETLLINGGPDGIVQGTPGNDLIDAEYVDPNGEMVDNGDGINGTTGDEDNIQAMEGNDTIYAGRANDTVTGGVDALASAAESLNWSTEGIGTDALGSFTQNVGIANITVKVVDDGALTGAEVDDSTQYVGTDEPFADDSALLLGGDGGADVATVTVSSDMTMENISFRINDIDSGTWQDLLTIRAFDENGDPVAVTLTAAGNDSTGNGSIVGGADNDSPDEAAGSVLVEIAGPATSFEIVYENGSTDGQITYITDVHFTSVQADNDTIHGDQADDTLFGNAGNDTIFGDQLALDPADHASTVGGAATNVTFENQSPYEVELAQIDASGALVSAGTIAAGNSVALASTDTTNWVFVDSTTGDILDFYEAPADGSTLVFDSAGADHLDGGTGNDDLSGDWGNDTLLGGEGNDQLSGGHGDDILNGGAGNDTISGGDGQDVIWFEDDFGKDTVDGNEGGIDFDSLDFSALSNGVDVTFSGDEAGSAQVGSDKADFLNIERVLGSEFDDTIDASASSVAQTLEAGGGIDTITGGSGDDNISGGDGADILTGGAGADVITGGDGADTIDGGDDADVIYGGSGDSVDGGEGGDDNDVLVVGYGASVVYDPGNPENGTVTFADNTTLDFQNIERVVPCFTPGTLVRTARGDIPVERLKIGDEVLTRDNGMQKVRWVGQRRVSKVDLEASPRLMPILIRKGALGPGAPERDMMVSPQHRMLMANSSVQLWLAESEVLVKAKDLVHRDGIEWADVETVDYVHFLCDAHEIVLADNCWTESFQPGAMVSAPGTRGVFEELLELFPELETEFGRRKYRAARYSATPREALLVA